MTAVIERAVLRARAGRVAVEGGDVHYEVVGGGAGVPLVVVHGGPGMPSDYLRALDDLAGARPVVYYDQLGCGRSDRPAGDAALWRLDRFVDELATVVAAAGAGPAVVLGHSWGALVAVSYALDARDAVAALVLASPSLDVPRLRRDRAALEAGVRADLGDAGEDRVVAELHARHVCRVSGLPEMAAALRGFGDEPYAALWESPDSPIRDLDLTGSLPGVAVPTLLTCGRHDFATPEAVGRYAAAIPGATALVFERSSHHAHVEERAEYVAALHEFLGRVDARHDVAAEAVENAVADAVRAVFGGVPVAPGDTIAGLGGTPFAAARVLARLSASGTGDLTPARALLAHRTVREIAEALRRAGWRPRNTKEER